MNAPLNRAQRRAMKKGRSGVQYRDVPLPAALDEFTVFDMPQTMLDKIEHGAIEEVQGEPVFRDNTGKLCYVCPALLGWIQTWELINTRLQAGLDVLPLQRVHNKLASSMPLTDADVAAAKETLLQMRRVFRTSDRRLIASIARDSQIKILMEDRKQ